MSSARVTSWRETPPRVWLRRYANYTEASVDIAQYIVGFYNTQRLHSTLGYRSPVKFEKSTCI